MTTETPSDTEKLRKPIAGRYRKGQARPAGAGRKPGSRNKLTLTVKNTFEAVFNELQRDPKTELAAWARRSKANLREFYRLAARLLPLEATITPLPPPPPADREKLLLETARSIGFLLASAEHAQESRIVQGDSSSIEDAQIVEAGPVEPVEAHGEVSATVPMPEAPDDGLSGLAARAEAGAIFGPGALPTKYRGGRRRP